MKIMIVKICGAMTHQKQVSEQFFTSPRRVACGGGVQRMGAASQLSPRPLQEKLLPSQTAKTKTNILNDGGFKK